MFAFWRRNARHIPEVVDSWKGSEGLYVEKFKRHLNEIATALSQGGRTVDTRFNPQLKCVELHVSGDVLAQVVVHGEVCLPEVAIVTSFLSDIEEKLFVDFLTISVKFKKASR